MGLARAERGARRGQRHAHPGSGRALVRGVDEWVERRAEETEEWAEAAVFEDRLLYLTPAELEDLSRQVGELLEPYARRVPTPTCAPRGARAATYIQLGFPIEEDGPTVRGRLMRRRVPRLLRVNRPFRDYWTGQTISLFGDQIALLAIPLLAVLTLNADAEQMGFLGAAELIPNLFFAFAFGAWADRRASRRAILIGADLGRAAILFGIPLASLFGVLTMPILYVAAFATGTLGTLFMVSEQTVFTSLVKPAEYVEANSLLIGSRSVSIVGGKTLGGLLVAALTAPVAIAVDAVTFLFSALFVRRAEVPEPPAAPPDSRPRRRRSASSAAPRCCRPRCSAPPPSTSSTPPSGRCSSSSPPGRWGSARARSGSPSASAPSAASSAPSGRSGSTSASASARR